MSKTILCADDSATMQKVAEITFKATEFSFVGARSADDALALAKKETPALILADAVMPGKTGYDLCRAIKAEASLAGVPVIIMCGNSEAYDEARGAQVGADGHVSKPWDTQKMMDQIAEIVDKTASGGVAKPAAGKPSVPDIPPKSAAAAKAAAAASAPRSSTLMGMPSLEMPPAKSTPGVTPIAPPSQARARAAVKTPAPPVKTPAPPVKTPAPAVNTPAVAAERAPMIKAQPSKPIRLVLASQVAEVATATAKGLGLDASQAAAVTELSREVLERVVWEVVPDLAEAIIRENLETLTAKAR